MSTRLPIKRDILDFEKRENKLFEEMERDMDRRRKDWEGEIDRMRKDFFTLRPTMGTVPQPKYGPFTDNVTSRVSENVDDARGAVERDDNGLPVFRARFNIKGFQPDEVNVKTDDSKIVVQAKHQGKEGGSTITREYNREINIPKDVDPLKLQCTMSPEGLLCVEAPLPVPEYASVKDTPKVQPVQHVQSSSFDSNLMGAPRSHISPTSVFTSAAPASSLFSGNVQKMSPVNMTEDEKKFTVEVDIEDFKPEELNVKTVDKKLIVSAKREEKIGNRTSTKQMSREFQLPENVEPTSVKAFFTESGKLHVEAPLVSSMSSTNIRLQ